MLHFLYCFFRVAGYWKCSNTNAHIDIHWFCRRQILDNRLGILTQNLIRMGYFFICVFQTYNFNLGEKYLNLGNQFHYKKYKVRDWNTSKRFVFSFSIIVFNMKFLLILFMTKSICYGKLFGSVYTSNGIYLLWNGFSNYVYLKDMYLSL